MIKGFSLVELSIVLVIIGLITGGIMTGQSLIRAAEMRSISTEHNQFSIAVDMFIDKYSALPGDMNNATSFWTGGITDDGNGDGDVHEDVAANAFSELYTFWQHLALAGLINGNFTGRDGDNNHHSIIGTNVPASKISGAGYSLDAHFYWGWDGSWPPNSYASSREHFMVFGLNRANSLSLEPLFSPEEVFNLDKKMDDGMAGRGAIKAYPRDNGCALATSATDYDASYDLSNKTKSCAIYFSEPFGLEVIHN